MTKELLIIFIKNPVLGKAKTRLAATLGSEKALAIYHQLIIKTREITQNLPLSLALYYSDFIPDADDWDNPVYRKQVQSGADLGARMQQAFRDEFERGYNRICIIGSDCFELTSEIIINAFVKLEAQEVVLGPAQDGGYYLLGMQKLWPFLFNGKSWSTELVLKQTLADIQQQGLSVALLPLLTDIDEEKDLPATGIIF
ncbi:MAG: glycosyltransferase [Adhaeribacter sp.]|nr:glycosyltransferase [Adhaeribacter sp.]